MIVQLCTWTVVEYAYNEDQHLAYMNELSKRDMILSVLLLKTVF